MRKRRQNTRLLLIFATSDTVGIVAGLAMAYALRFTAGVIEVTKDYSPRTYLEILPLAIAVWLFWLQSVGAYEFKERAFNLQILKRLVRANVLAVMTFVAVHFFTRTFDFSRLVYLMAMITGTVSLAATRFLLDRTLAWMRRTGRFESAHVAILGTGPLARNIANRISHHSLLGLRMTGFITSHPGEATGEVDGYPVLGNFTDVRQIVRQHSLAEIIVAQPELPPREVLDFAIECDKEIASVRVVPNILEAMLIEASVEQIDGIPLFGLKDSPLQGWNVILKRGFDFAFSALALIALSPLLLLIAFAVKLSSPGPVLYKQRRVGLDGRRFNIYKFRSMRPGAEDTSGPVYATKGDPRVTPVGRLLRRLSLDELPQLWNVLRGDMSLVGPRPERPHFVRQFREQIPRYMGRHRVKSGMTGWAQVHGLRQNTPMDERVQFDLYYIENWSFWLDLKIMLMTLRAINEPEHSY